MDFYWDKKFLPFGSNLILMKKSLATLFCLFILGVLQASFAQTPQFPIVKGYGGIYEIPEATERPDPTKEISRWVDNVARMMNLHGLAGVPKEKLDVKVIIHGGSIFTLLNDENYQKRFEVANPNIKVFEALKEAGADIMVCGQSLLARNLKQQDLWPGVRIAHSALTTITTYVPQGYVLVKF